MFLHVFIQQIRVLILLVAIDTNHMIGEMFLPVVHVQFPLAGDRLFTFGAFHRIIEILRSLFVLLDMLLESVLKACRKRGVAQRAQKLGVRWLRTVGLSIHPPFDV